MSTIKEPTDTMQGSGQPGLSTILLSALWILAVAGAVGQYFLKRQAWDALVGLSALLFGLGLIWTLGRTRPAISELPTLDVFTAKRLGFWIRTLLLFLGLALTLLLGMTISPGFSLMLVCGLLGLGVTLTWRKSLTWTIAGTGLAVGLISALGTVFLGTGDLVFAAAYLVTIPPAFTGGALLLGRTQLGHVRILEGRPALVLRGFLVGCVLGVPAGLFNLLGNIQGQDTYIIHWWQPLYAIVPAIAEETWARLFLVSCVYAVLRPATELRPQRAVVVAILISILAFSFAHAGLNPFVIIIDGLLFSTPFALLMIKKDFEHAVGYHFMTDFVRFIAALLS
jgi:hypothetical protein